MFVRRYEFYDQNIGVVLGDRAVLVIDTRSTHVQAREIAADLRAYPLDWPATADALAALVSGIVVPGHGDYAGHAFAVQQATAIGAVADLARRIDAEDLGLEDAIALTPFPAFPPEDIRAPLKRALAQVQGDLS